jgi:hypothetical protein
VAKNKKRVKTSEKQFDIKNAIKEFTKNQVGIIGMLLKDIDEHTLLTNIYIKSDDEEVEKLIRLYEKQIVVSKVNPSQFKMNLHKFFKDTAKHIKENSLYEKFFQLVHLSYVTMATNNSEKNVLTAYQDLLMQQYIYLGGTTKRIICGLSEKQGVLTIPEIIPNLTEVNYEIAVTKNLEKADAIYRKYGHKVSNMIEVQRLSSFDQLNTCMIYQMAYFISEENIHLIEKPFSDPNIFYEINKDVYRKGNIEEINERLTRRQRLLPSNGVICEIYNGGDIKEIKLEETLKDDSVILLYKVKFSDKTHTSGFYDVNNRVFYSVWSDSNYITYIHQPLQYMVLQNYLKLTCDLSLEEKERYLTIEDRLKTKEIDFSLIYVDYSILTDIEEVNTIYSKGGNRRSLEKYDIKLRKIDSKTRNLPIGANASPEAIAKAKKLGIELPKGKTFVESFKKRVYTTKDN